MSPSTEAPCSLAKTPSKAGIDVRESDRIRDVGVDRATLDQQDRAWCLVKPLEPNTQFPLRVVSYKSPRTKFA